MANGPYETVLEELGDLLQAGELQPDRHNTCLIRLISGLEVYVEMDRSANFLILAANLGDPGPGIYRDDLFRAALKMNGGSQPICGVLGFSDESNELIIYEKIPLENINGDRVLERLTPFEEKAVMWKEAIKNNEVPVVESVYTTRRMGMFGLQP